MKRLSIQNVGFTLIELMIVVAIIGLLAFVAVPVYKQYVLKSKFSTVIATIKANKTLLLGNLSDHYSYDDGKLDRGRFSCNNISKTTFFTTKNFSFEVSVAADCTVVGIARKFIDNVDIQYSETPLTNSNGDITWLRPESQNNCSKYDVC